MNGVYAVARIESVEGGFARVRRPHPREGRPRPSPSCQASAAAAHAAKSASERAAREAPTRLAPES